MSELSDTNIAMRLAAIKTVLRNHPLLLQELLTPDGEGMNLEATPEALDFDEPADIIVRLAWDIWNGTGETEFDKVLDQLPQPDFEAFIDAMRDFSQLRRKIWSLYASGSEDD